MRTLLETAMAGFVVGRATYRKAVHELGRAISLADQAIYEIDRSSPRLGEAVRWVTAPVTLPIVVAAVVLSPEAGERFANRRHDHWN